MCNAKNLPTNPKHRPAISDLPATHTPAPNAEDNDSSGYENHPHARGRMDNLIVRALMDGQLSFNATLGLRVDNRCTGEMCDGHSRYIPDYEYYIDRVQGIENGNSSGRNIYTRVESRSAKDWQSMWICVTVPCPTTYAWQKFPAAGGADNRKRLSSFHAAIFPNHR